MKLKFTIEVELTKNRGRFVGKEALADSIAEVLGEADPGTFDIEDSEYETVDWSVYWDPQT